MAESGTFENQKKLRKAELITPPNILKQKLGSGGISEATLVKAQQALEDNTTDFRPFATVLLTLLDNAIEHARKPTSESEPAIEAMIYPAVQLKAQGAMFHFPLVTDLSDILVSFLETVTGVDEDVLEIVVAHKTAISAVISNNMTGSGGAQGKELRDSLTDVCIRYYKLREMTPATDSPPEDPEANT